MTSSYIVTLVVGLMLWDGSGGGGEVSDAMSYLTSKKRVYLRPL